MIRKFIIGGVERVVSKKFKGIQKLKPQKVKKQLGISRSSEIADQNIRDTLGPDPLEFGSVTHKPGNILRRESIARRLTERKFIKDLPKELKKGRIVIARKLKSFDPIKKSAYKPIKSPTSTDIKFQSYPKKFRTSIDLKKAKSASAFKRYKSVEKASDKIFTDITEKRSPFKHKTTDIKFIKSKRFKKGLPKGQTQRTMSWAPKDELTKGQKISWARKQAQQEKIFSSGQGYFDPQSQSFKWKPKKKR